MSLNTIIDPTTDPNDDARARVSLEEAAQGFAAIGSEPRLDVLLALVRAGPGGLAVGEIQRRVAIPASTLTHHLRFLTAAGLVEQARDGRTIRNRAAFERIAGLAAYLLEQCCAEPSDSAHAAPHDHGAHRHD